MKTTRKAHRFFPEFRIPVSGFHEDYLKSPPWIFCFDFQSDTQIFFMRETEKNEEIKGERTLKNVQKLCVDGPSIEKAKHRKTLKDFPIFYNGEIFLRLAF